MAAGQESARWLPAPEPAATATLVAAGLDPLEAALLARRGVTTAEEATSFLRPAADQLLNPFGLPSMEAAVARLLRAREEGQRVAVVGDYDVDGVSATAILTAAFRARGLEVEPILPHRLLEGYGFQPVHVERAREAGCSLIVTADCGTTSTAAVEASRQAGLDVIITDHHLPGAGLPAGTLQINPKLPDSRYGFDELCGAGLALKLALAWGERSGKALPLDGLLRIAALGTIADMVPLVGENRIIASLGLAALARSRSPGLRALIHQAGIKPPFRASDVGFRLGPRINAAGRLGSADSALELLLSRDGDRARELAGQLELWNRQRQAEELRAVEEAREEVLKAEPMPKILVAWSPDWHRGVVGIAAGRLAREFHRPAILLSVEDGSATGSGRSVPGLHLHRFLETWRDQLERFGGHAQAIGLTVAADRLPELSAAWRQAAEAWEDEALSRRFEYEAHLVPRDLTEDLLRRFEALEPFGEGNRQPLLRVGPLRLRGAPRKFSNGHLSAMVEGEDGFPARLLGWGWGDRAGRFEGRFEVLAYLERDHYRGGSTLRLLDSRAL